MMTTEVKSKIIEMYKSGTGSDTIAKQMGVSSNSILKLLKRSGIDRRPIGRKKIQVEDEPKIIEMYLEGMSAPEIAEKFNVAHTLILRYLKLNNIKRRDASECHRIYEINEDFFDVIDSQEKAYFLGFLYADGCNSKDGKHFGIELETSDRDILEKMSRLIWTENPLDHIKDTIRNRSVRGAKEKDYYSSLLNVHSKHMCMKLTELGCVQAKSLILKFPEWLKDSELQRHFIRGHYDGDGGVHISDIRKNIVTTKITSTKEFCGSVRDIVFEQTGIKFGEPSLVSKEKRNTYIIGMSGTRQIQNFLSWLYKDATIYLDRKYNLYLELIEKNKETQELIKAGTQGYSYRYLVGSNGLRLT
jgi:hypothetical protein